MAKVDMHVHSKYSGRPSDWFLKKFGANESYTEPEFIYKTAKERGMDFVVVTDHNNIQAAKLLKEKYPEEIIIGCEFTAYFPEDNCKIHLLTYGISEKQFRDINQIRNDIYVTRDYIKKNKIAHSVAHATYSVNGKLTVEHLEKLILLFDVFENINGSRNKMGNEVWTQTLKNLNPQHIEKLYNKYKIEPYSEDAWIKGFTGGSDDHAALYIGRTYTEAEAKSSVEFLKRLKNKKTAAGGRHNDYKSFAFTLYKIIYDFSRSKSVKIPKSFFSQLSDLIFEKKGLSFINWLKSRKLKNNKKKDKESFKYYLSEMIEGLNNDRHKNLDEKLDFVFDKIADIFDSFIKLLAKSTRKSLKKGDIVSLIKNISSFLPGAFLSVPFFSTLTHMYSGRKMLDELKKRFIPQHSKRKKRIMWFTDTITYLNGVSVTLRKIGWLCNDTGRDLVLVSSVKDDEITEDLPPNFVNIPSVYEFELPHYESIVLKIPSLMKTVEMLYQYEPDEIYISSPGPMGIFALFFAKLINARTVGVYHTDFTEQARRILIKEETVANFIEAGNKCFFSQMDKIAVPTNEYIDILAERGYEIKKMEVFSRGMDHDFFTPEYTSLKDFLNLKKGINLLYSGRISKDKNIDFLIDVYKQVTNTNKKVNLIIVGDGPYLKELKNKMRKKDRIYFTGRMPREELPAVYSGADLFLFPSNTDTFGMVVLEAQSCGLPAIVSDIGGPKEIVKDRLTGYILGTESTTEWVKRINKIINKINDSSIGILKMRKSARENVINNYDWEKVLKHIFEEKTQVFGKNKEKIENVDILIKMA